jgi:hypothetical protein
MYYAAFAMNLIVRLSGAVVLLLGALFWSGRSLDLILFHSLAGLLLVGSLWGLACLAVASGVTRGLGFVAIAWGGLVVTLGTAQQHLFPGSAHWSIQLLHLLFGLTAIFLAQRLAKALQRTYQHVLAS